MALLWEKRAAGVHYAVRRAGSVLRLYTNGVLHTQWSPRHDWTGSVWDLLAIPALALPPAQVQRILVLGVGGGAVIRQLLRLFPAARITGVELNAVHVQVARRHFGLRDPRVQLVCDNAVTWLAMRDGEPWDLVIDDLFGERDGVPARAVRADADWLDLLAGNVAPGGALVLNFAGRRELAAAPWRALPGFRAALSLSTPSCENRVLALLPRPPADLAAAVAAAGRGRDRPRWRARRLR